jgi:hypothetical protein
MGMLFADRLLVSHFFSKGYEWPFCILALYTVVGGDMLKKATAWMFFGLFGSFLLRDRVPDRVSLRPLVCVRRTALHAVVREFSVRLLRPAVWDMGLDGDTCLGAA